MLKVGLTGGIGSGKSTVAQVFHVLNIPVFFADTEARSLMHSDPAVRQQIITLLGTESYDTSGALDRKFVASRAFGDERMLAALNAIVHPAVRDAFRKWYDGQQNQPYVLEEAAILFESGAADGMDLNILVYAPEDVRIDRVVQRDGVSEDQVRSRMGQQWTDKEKMERADFIIINDGQHSVLSQVLDIHRALIHVHSGT